MGYSITWLAFSGIDAATGLTRLGLGDSGAPAEYGAVPFAGSTLSNGWVLVVAQGSDNPLAAEPGLARLSAGCAVVACRIEEHVMACSAERWQDGARSWRVEHDAQRSARHLLATGALPAEYVALVRAATTQQDAEDPSGEEVDFFFEVPPQLAAAATGFKHDEPGDAVDLDGFTRLVRVGT